MWNQIILELFVGWIWGMSAIDNSIDIPKSFHLSSACIAEVDAGPDQFICQPETVQLDGTIDNVLFSLWSPWSGLSDPNLLDPTATITNTITYTLTGWGIDPNNPNIIVNGDFEDGNTGFTSDYMYVQDIPVVQNEMVPAGTYTVINNPFLVHDAWSQCMDHTPGTADQMMLINGELSLQDFWCQTVPVLPNTYYNIESWVSSVHPSSPAILQFSINGTPVGQIINAPSTTCQWIPFNALWFSGSTSTAEICIINLNTTAFGNDFALDDISMVALCEVSDEVTIFLEPEPAPVPEITGPDVVCIDEIATYLASLPPQPEVINYIWTITGGTIISGQGTIQVTVEWNDVSNGSLCLMIETACDDSESCIDVLINQLPENPSISGPATLCPGATGTFYTENFEPGDDFNWIIPPQVTLISGQGTNEIVVAWAATGEIDLCLEVTNECGTNDDCISVLLFEDYLTFFNTLLCDGQVIVINGTVYGNGNLSGVENFISINGCDSIVEINIEEAPALEFFNEVSLCPGDSIFLEGAYQTTDGIYIDSFITISGCDSILITEVTVSLTDTTFIHSTSCDPVDVGIFIETFTSGNCDSTVVTQISLEASDTTTIILTSCIPADTGTTIIMLTNQAGCDSLLITNTLLALSDTTRLFLTSCIPADTGTTTILLSNQAGCDSLVITNTIYQLSDTTRLFQTSCNPDDEGVVTQELTNINGCDSLVITTITFVLSDTTYLTIQTCTYSDTSTTSILLTNLKGCDSLVIQQTIYAGSDTTFLFSESCFIADTGWAYANLTNQYGCDSIIGTFTNFLSSDTTLQTLTSCNPQDTGLVILELQNFLGCDSLVFIQTILELPEQCLLIADFTIEQPLCFGDTAWLIATIELGIGPFTMLWVNQGSNGSHSFSSSGIFRIPFELPGQTIIELEAANGLSMLDTVIMNVPPLLAIEARLDTSYGGFGVPCNGDTTGKAYVEILGTGTPPLNFAWSNGSMSNQLGNLSSGTYYVSVTDKNNCTVVDSVTITEPAPFMYNVTIQDIPCFGANGGVIIEILSGGTLPWQTSLNGDEFVNTLSYSNLTTGNYHLFLKDANGCMAEESFTLNEPPQWSIEVGADTSIVYGSSITITPQISGVVSDSIVLEWSDEKCENCLSRTFEIVSDILLTVTATDQNGCSASDVILLKVQIPLEITIPNVFSPNGDNVNDYFFISTNPFIEEIEDLSIFDRWGNMVFQKLKFPPNEPLLGWDGKFHGQLFNPAVFAYKVVVHFKDGRKRVFHGDVTLIR